MWGQGQLYIVWSMFWSFRVALNSKNELNLIHHKFIDTIGKRREKIIITIAFEVYPSILSKSM